MLKWGSCCYCLVVVLFPLRTKAKPENGKISPVCECTYTLFTLKLLHSLFLLVHFQELALLNTMGIMLKVEDVTQ